MSHEVSLEVGGRTLTLQTGKVAKQADGAVMVSYSDSVVLVTVVSSHSPREGIDSSTRQARRSRSKRKFASYALV